MIQTKNQDAYKSCEFLNILAGKRVGPQCKAFTYLIKQRDSFVATLHKEQESETSILSCLENNSCKNTASIESIKTDVKSTIAQQKDKCINIVESLEFNKDDLIKLEEKKIANELNKITEFNYNKQVTALDLYKPTTFFHFSIFVLTTPSIQMSCDLSENKILNSNLDKTAAKGNVEKLPVANCESLMMSEEKNNENSFSERVKKYKKNPSFIKAYIEKTKFKGSNANKSRKVTFSQYVEVIEYVKLDYKVPLYNYEYDLK